MNRRCWIVAVLIIAFVGLSEAARAMSWVGESLELNVSDAELVVVATIEATENAGQANETVTLRIKDVLKSPTDLTMSKTLSAVPRFDDDRNLKAWRKDKAELLVCLVKAERYRVKVDRRPMVAAWAIRRGISIETGEIPLDGKPDRRAPTLDFVFLKNGEDIRKLAVDVITEDARHQTPRMADGSFPSIGVNVPADSPMNRELHTKSTNALLVPLTTRAEVAARRWVNAADPFSRMNAIQVLSHFKSDQNIALLKSLLNDPNAQYRVAGDRTITTYPVRAAAVKALRAWGIDSDAVIEETK